MITGRAAGRVGRVEPFQVRIAVRGYELDPRGHVNQAVYLQYAEHARWECLRAAGITHDRLHEDGVGPVALEQTIRFYAELRADDEVDVGCEFHWGEGKTFEVVQPIHRPDGTRVAELTGVAGLLDLSERRLVFDPGGRFRALATAPEILGL
jgi:acyl-CoA thioester hydrolase